RGKNEERRQHDELALGEIDRLRCLPEQREPDGNQRINCTGREAGYQKLNEGSHWRRPLASARRSRRAEEINERSVAELRKGFDDFLLAVDNLTQKADPVYVAVLVPGCFHQNAGLVLGRDGDAVRGLRKSLAVELANFLGDVLDEIDCRVALDTIVVTSIVEPLFELLGELLHG